jgi:hypothetical protein
MDIRSILNIINENAADVKKPAALSDNLTVMSLDQFLHHAGIEPHEEVDEAKLDAPSRKMSNDDMKKYLDRIMGTPVLDPETGEPKKTASGSERYVSGKTKQDKFRNPYIHRQNVPIVNDEGERYDLNKLRAAITARPAKLLQQNEKMVHSDGSASAFYNVSLPALKGLAVDEDTGEFIIIDTCPGAGACQVYCFALKGGYVQWKGVSLFQSKMLNFLYNDPAGFMNSLGAEIETVSHRLAKADKRTGTETKLIIRWHDAGDFFSPEYLDHAYDLARKMPDVDFYAYTKIADVAQSEKPENFKINYSMGAKPAQEKKIDFTKTKNSRVVPEVLFKDLLDRVDGKVIYKDKQATNTLKNRIAAKYSVDPDSILTYDEMMKKPQGKAGQYNVIVKPGDGDDAANRSDVLNSFLLMH